MLRALRWPLALAFVNYLIWGLTLAAFSVLAASVAFNVSRLAIMVWAGWLVATRTARGAMAAAFAGVAILVVDHVLLKGGAFLVMHWRADDPAEAHKLLMAFGGVIISFVMFCPLAALLGCIGWWFGRRRSRGRLDSAVQGPAAAP